MLEAQTYKMFFNNEAISQRRIKLLNIYLNITIISLAFFLLYDLLIADKLLLAKLSGGALFLFLLIKADYHYHKNFSRTATAGTMVLMFYFLLLTVLTSNSDMMLLWTVLFPLYALPINGRKLGIIYSALYFVLLMLIMLPGINIWNNQGFTQLAFVHTLAVLAILSFALYFFERSYQANVQELNSQKCLLETFFRQSHDGVLIIKEGRFIDCNEASMQMLGATSKAQVIDTLPSDISPAKQPNGQGSLEKAQAMIQLALESGSANFECYHKRFNGEIFVVDATLTRLNINNENVIHASWRDITQKKLLEEKLNNYQTDLEQKVAEKTQELQIQKDKAEQASQAKSEFLANMNHELRTPMNAILGFIHLLAKDETDTKRKKYFNFVEEGSEALLNIINDVLDFSKIESGKFTLDLNDANLANSSKNFIEFLGGAAKKKSIRYTVAISDNIPVMHTDVLRFQQIISNLIGNAIKFTPNEGEVNVSLTFDETTQMLRFSVEDTGIGISKEDQAKIFEPFLQADMTTTRVHGGTGLGLTISLHLIKMLEGELTLASELNKGSQFSFEIPYKKPLGHSTKPHDAPISSENHPTEDIPILVAEDNDVNLYLYQELFEKLEIPNITFVSNGLEAIEAYIKTPFKLILLDINMPTMNGKETFEKIRLYEKENRIAPSTIVALTANSDEASKKELFALGFDDFLPKPINFDSFQKLLNQYV